MRREGSAFSGLGVVVLKELSDHLTGIRMIVLEWLVVLMALGVVYTGIQQIREVSAEDPFLFLRLFTRAGEGLPSFVSVLSFLVPLVAIGIGFDLVNSERNQRTLSRILAQPIYRDALLFGKFLAGLFTITIMLVSLWLMVIGLGILTLGLPPGAEEVARAVAMLVVTVIYAGVWLALALLFSIIFRSAATAALAALGLWLFLTVLWPLLSPYLAAIFAPSDTVTTPSELLTPFGCVAKRSLDCRQELCSAKLWVYCLTPRFDLLSSRFSRLWARPCFSRAPSRARHCRFFRAWRLFGPRRSA